MDIDFKEDMSGIEATRKIKEISPANESRDHDRLRR